MHCVNKKCFSAPNAQPVVVEKLPWETVVEIQNQKYAHAKHVYYITSSSMAKLRGCQVDMCSYMPRHSGRIKVCVWVWVCLLCVCVIVCLCVHHGVVADCWRAL